MEFQIQILLYLDQKHILTSIKHESDKFLNELKEQTTNKFPPFRYILEIDVMELIDIFPIIGELLLKEPLKLQRVCNQVLFACLHSVAENQSENTIQYNIEFAQVGTNLRLKNVPRLSVMRNPQRYSGMVRFEGILMAVSKPSSYAIHTVWSCPEECEGNEVILQYIPKKPLKCCVCRSVLYENSGMRMCGEQVMGTFKINNCFQLKNFAIVDDLITKLKIGSMYILNVVVLKNTKSVWSIEEIVPLPSPSTCPIPADIVDLLRTCNGISWKFVYCLASSIGVRVCPLNCFMHLKICLLLSLASVKANSVTGSVILHVLTAGYDTGYVARLMNEAVKLADRVFFVGTSNNVVTNTLIASSGGVCAMPLPLHVYNQKQISLILSAVESGEIPTESAKPKLRCAVWAQGMDFKKFAVFNIAGVFGTVCRGDYGEYNDEIVDFHLKNAIEPLEITNEEREALKDVVKYIDLVAGIRISLSAISETILRNYFLAARKESPKGATVGCMGALVAICLTSARLCRRTLTDVDDAIFAIWLHVSGSPEPRFAPDEYLQTPADIKKLQSSMDGFKSYLEQFTGCVLNSL